MHYILLIFLLVLFQPTIVKAFDDSIIPQDWPHQDGKHFIIISSPSINIQQSNQVLTKAEEYYDRITSRLGFTRYGNYWTWENRVKIIFFANAQEFTNQTGQPSWSQGFAASHALSSGGKFIVSFDGQIDFISSILPHEIGHLILHDFMHQQPIPVFFDEGVAQLEEEHQEQAEVIMASLVNNKQHIPFTTIINLIPNSQFDQRAASIFYAESLYIVDFLIKTYGSEKFVHLCRLMRDGVNFEAAIIKAYYPTVTGLDNLEILWAQYLVIKAGIN